jgi:hypothetical protein
MTADQDPLFGPNGEPEHAEFADCSAHMSVEVNRVKRLLREWAEKHGERSDTATE